MSGSLRAFPAMVLLLGFGGVSTIFGQVIVRPSPFSPTGPNTVYPTRRLADGVYAVLGDTGRGAEGRPNAGFVVTPEGVVAVGGTASPVQGTALVRTIGRITRRPIRWFVLNAHHPDMQFGTISLRRAGARVIAHPDTHVLASEGGADAMLADWDAVVGLQELIGFEYADTPDRPVTGTDTLLLGGRTMIITHPANAHSAGDLMLWLPKERVLFTGDILMDDGVTMVVDGSSGALLKALDSIDSLNPRVIVPGHGAIPTDPSALVAQTRNYITELRVAMKTEVEKGHSLRTAVETLPPPDDKRPVSIASRRRRNATRVYLEMEREVMGLDSEQ